MNIQSRLDQFRADNPYDVDTQAKRLLATDDKELILYVLALGFATAKQRQRHYERDFIKNVGEAPPKERLVPRRGGATGSVVPIKIEASQKARNAARQLILDIWHCGDKPLGVTTALDMAEAIKRENASSNGHQKNAQFYAIIKERLKPDGTDTVAMKWDEKTIRKTIETVYGEFRKSEAA